MSCGLLQAWTGHHTGRGRTLCLPQQLPGPHIHSSSPICLVAGSSFHLVLGSGQLWLHWLRPWCGEGMAEWSQRIGGLTSLHFWPLGSSSSTEALCCFPGKLVEKFSSLGLEISGNSWLIIQGTAGAHVHPWAWVVGHCHGFGEVGSYSYSRNLTQILLHLLTLSISLAFLSLCTNEANLSRWSGNVLPRHPGKWECWGQSSQRTFHLAIGM